MRIGIPREIHDGERRVATTPDVVKQLKQLGFTVQIESGAGEAASLPDAAFSAAGADVATDVRSLWSTSDIILKVRAPERHPALGVDETDLLHEGQVLISFLWPAQNPELLQPPPHDKHFPAQDPGRQILDLIRALKNGRGFSWQAALQTERQAGFLPNQDFMTKH